MDKPGVSPDARVIIDTLAKETGVSPEDVEKILRRLGLEDALQPTISLETIRLVFPSTHM